MSASTERLERLRAIPLFADLPEPALRRIVRMAAEIGVPAGTVLIQPGTAGSGLFVVQEGQVTVTIPGKRPITGGPGDFFGELALLTDGVRTARVQARTGVRCLAIGRSDFARLLTEEPKMGIAMLGTLARRLAEATK